VISAGVLHRLPSERATEPFALLRVLPRRRFIARYARMDHMDAILWHPYDPSVIYTRNNLFQGACLDIP